NLLAETGDAQAKMILEMGQRAGALRLDAEGLIIKAAKNRTKEEDEEAQKRAIATEDAAQKMTRAATNFSDVSSEIMGQTRDLILTALEKPLENLVGHMGDAVEGIRDLVSDNAKFLKEMSDKISGVGGDLTGSLGGLALTVGGAAAAVVGFKVATGMVAKSLLKKGGSKTIAGIAKGVGAGKAAGRTVAKEAGEEIAEGILKKGVAKTAGKSIFKSLLKKIPGIGLIAGLGFAAGRIAEGDFAGAGMEVASGVAGLVPGPGTAAGIGIDVGLAARDIAREQEATEAGAAGAGAAAATAARGPGHWKMVGRGRRVWVPEEGAEEAGPGEISPEAEAALTAGLTGHELLTQMNDALQHQNEVLMGIANA
ncbi:hypothetical protein LCGC14_2988430, partial [marine sediment metagenome]